MIYGYARVSTMGQARDGNSMEAQVCALKQAGAVKIFKDVFSGKSEHRPQLDKPTVLSSKKPRLHICEVNRLLPSLVQWQGDVLSFHDSYHGITRCSFVLPY